MKKEIDIFDKPENIKKLKIISYICLAIVVAVDFFIPRDHGHYPWDQIPGFYAVFGLVACILIVIMAKKLGKLWLMKKEDYYD